MKLMRKIELMTAAVAIGLLFAGCSHPSEIFSSASTMPVMLRDARAATLAVNEPELPRVYLETTYIQPTGRTIAVAAGGDLQAAIDQAKFGDVLMLQAGATFTGNFILPNKSSSGQNAGQNPSWITIRTSAPDTSLPSH